MSTRKDDGAKYSSYSEAHVQDTCGHKRWLMYDKGLKEAQNVYSYFGDQVHLAIKRKLQDGWERPWIAMARNIYKWIQKNPIDKWYFKREKKELNPVQWIKFAYGMYNEVFDWMDKTFKNYELLASEYKIFQPIEEVKDYNFMGVIDLIIHTKDDDKYHIIDFKTAALKDWDEKKRNDITKHYQVLIYKNFFSKITLLPLDKIETHFILLKGNTTQEQEKCELITVSGDVNEASQWLVKNTRLISKNMAFKKRGSHCYLCPFHKTQHCP